MAWEARSGLKLVFQGHMAIGDRGLNGLGSPFGIETICFILLQVNFLWLNGLGSPFGIETLHRAMHPHSAAYG